MDAFVPEEVVLPTTEVADSDFVEDKDGHDACSEVLEDGDEASAASESHGVGGNNEASAQGRRC